MRIVFLFLVCHLFVAARAIYNGNRVKIENIPYIVLLKNDKLFCSGALISNRHILTAAHCIDTNQMVYIGTDNYYQNYKENPNLKIFNVSKTWKHENFSLPSAIYDIAVIELSTSVEFSKDVQSIRISTKNNVEHVLKDSYVVTAGFGYSENSIGASDHLQYARMQMISLKKCKEFKDNYVEDLNDNHICLTQVKGQPCDGDSGAPVISVETKELVGIISYIKDAEDGNSIDYNDCEALAPAVATRVSSYLDWITKKTGLKLNRQ